MELRRMIFTLTTGSLTSIGPRIPIYKREWHQRVQQSEF